MDFCRCACGPDLRVCDALSDALEDSCRGLSVKSWVVGRLVWYRVVTDHERRLRECLWRASWCSLLSGQLSAGLDSFKFV